MSLFVAASEEGQGPISLDPKTLSPAALLSKIAQADSFLREIRPPPSGSLSFASEGVTFQARHENLGDTTRLTLWGEIGFLPFSVSSVERRRNLIAILEGARSLKTVKIGVTAQMEIVAMGEYHIQAPIAPDYVFAPIISFMQEARPFIRLIAEQL